MNKTCLAIITTVYNDSVYLKSLLVSLLNQTHHSFKHYIYEDGSKETCEEIINWYKNEIIHRKIDVEVKYFKSDVNIGVDKGHEFLFKQIHENYFCWIDSDDWVRKDFCEIIFNNIKKYPNIDIFHINSSQYDKNRNVIIKSTMSLLSKNVINSVDQFPAYCLGGQRFFHNFVIKLDSFKSVNPDLKIFSKNERQVFWYDAQILFEMCLFHKKYKLIKQPISCILNRPTSVSRSNRKLSKIDRQTDLNSLKYIIKNLYYKEKDTSMFFELFKLAMDYFKKLTWDYIDNNYLDAYKFYKYYKKTIKALNLPSNYVNLKKGIPLLFLRKKIFIILAPLIKIIRIIRKKSG